MDKVFIRRNLLEDDLEMKAKCWSTTVDSEEFASRLDSEDPLRGFREKFHYPMKKCISKEEDNNNDEECIYFCGHSLGLQLKCIENDLQEVLKNWANRGVESHFHGKFPAALCDDMLKKNMAYLVGAEVNEVAVMNSLTVNIHVLLSTFYRPTAGRYKIMMLEYGFHSDLYAVQSHVRLRGYDPHDAIVFLKPRKDSKTLDLSDIISFIEEKGDQFALVFFEGVHFYTGQRMDIEAITKAGHEKGCTVGFDLAHAVGNTRLRLHEWNVDFAMWCTYKYLNSGAGSLGAIFVHERHTASGKDSVQPMMAGWWGIGNKFSLSREFEAAEGADRFKISNPSPFLVAMIHASLQVFKEAGLDRILEKQRLLTGYLEYLLRRHFCRNGRFLEIITPADPERRGSQMSFVSLVPTATLENALKAKGIVCDIRKPSIIRVTPAPLYNTFTEVYKFVHILKDIFDTLPAKNGA